jgi:hypothetical protein
MVVDDVLAGTDAPVIVYVAVVDISVVVAVVVAVVETVQRRDEALIVALVAISEREIGEQLCRMCDGPSATTTEPKQLVSSWRRAREPRAMIRLRCSGGPT